MNDEAQRVITIAQTAPISDARFAVHAVTETKKLANRGEVISGLKSAHIWRMLAAQANEFAVVRHEAFDIGTGSSSCAREQRLPPITDPDPSTQG